MNFRRERRSLEDETCTSRPVTVATTDHAEAVRKLTPKHTKGQKERFLTRQNTTGYKFFLGNPLFQCFVLYKNKRNKSLIFCQFDSRALFLPQESNWQKISEMFVCLCIVQSFEQEYFLQNAHLSCVV